MVSARDGKKKTTAKRTARPGTKKVTKKTAKKVTTGKATKKVTRKTTKKTAGKTVKKTARKITKKTTEKVTGKVTRKTILKPAVKKAGRKVARKVAGKADAKERSEKAAVRATAQIHAGIKSARIADLSRKPVSRSGSSATSLALAPDQLRWVCNLTDCGFSNTEDMPQFAGIIGQTRAIEAITMGLKMFSKGYNIYVAGPPGTGKMTTVKHLLSEVETGRTIPPDVVYVNNFQEPDMPRSILLEAGMGKKLQRDMELLVNNMCRNIAQIYESDDFKESMKAVVENFKEKEKVILRGFEDKIRKENFALIQVQMGPFSKPEIAPVIAGEPVQIERLESLALEGKFNAGELARLKEKYEELTVDMENAFRASRDLKRELRDAMAKMQKEFGSPAVTDYITDLKQAYNQKDVLEYLVEVQEAILDNMERFIDNGEEENEQKPKQDDEKEKRFQDFSVNILVDNSQTKKPPVIIETSPNYRNLFGTIERAVDRSGHWISDFTKIKGGSLLRANGGTLVINLMDAIVEQGVWVALKRALKHRKIDIQTFDPFYILSVSALKPGPIDLDVKIVVLGDRYAYHMLYNYDEDFRKIFKIKAEFDNVMGMSDENVMKYLNFTRKITSEEKLLPMEVSGIATLIEYGVRLGGRKTRISTQFSTIADIIREADLWARGESAELITPGHVEKAIAERQRRVNLTEEKMRNLIEEGVIFIDSEGKRVGQINGLSVLDLGDYAFGQPSRITVKCALGREGIVNIEREANMSGKTHNKGVLILEGYIRSMFAFNKPLAINATICFEQNYGGIDGDSASSTEVYGLLSAIAGVPLRQDIAVTGSINQHGEIQPIGGANEKIEGFFDICRLRGLTGTQGVIIPAANINDLMLRRQVVDAVQDGKFTIWAVSTIEEGIEILTGQSAGVRNRAGKYPASSIFGRVDKQLMEFAMTYKTFGQKKKMKKTTKK